MILTAAGCCAAAAVAGWAIYERTPAVEYRTAAVERGDINVTISATGNPNAVVTVQVGSQVSGTIQSLYADFNTKVSKGQLIARIDPAALQARVDQGRATLDSSKANAAAAEAGVLKARAGIDSAKAALASARASWLKTQFSAKDLKVKSDRHDILAMEKLISREEAETSHAAYDTADAEQEAVLEQQHAAENNVKVTQAESKVADTQLVAAKAQVRQSQAALQSSQIDLDHTYIKAPVDGVVVSRRVDVGQTVAASLATPTLFEIAQDLTKMQVDTNVSEADVGRVRVSQPATFTVEAYPGQTFHGSVTEIRKAPINVQNVITYDVVIGVSNPDLKLFPGMTANVRILVTQRPQALRVLNAALRFRPASVVATAQRRKSAAVEQAVWIVDPKGLPQRVAVTTGETDGTYTELSGGDLKEGDRVIVAVSSKTTAAAAAPRATGRGPGF